MFSNIIISSTPVCTVDETIDLNNFFSHRTGYLYLGACVILNFPLIILKLTDDYPDRTQAEADLHLTIDRCPCTLRNKRFIAFFGFQCKAGISTGKPQRSHSFLDTVIIINYYLGRLSY